MSVRDSLIPPPDDAGREPVSDGLTEADLAVLVRSLIATLDDPAFALPDGKQTNILLVPGDVQVESGMLPFAVVLARGERATQLETLVREQILSRRTGLRDID